MTKRQGSRCGPITVEQTTLDVVFVHGLGGDSRDTWTNKDGIFWPETWLKADLPEIALYEYGYSAHPISGQTGIVAHASNMLAWLSAKDIGSRPVIFICHSLGGILVKEVMRQAEKSNPSLTTNIKGIAFFGTPHLGSGVAGIIKYIPGFTNVVWELSPGSDFLVSLNNWFKGFATASNTPLLAYVEGAKYKGTAIIVEPQSALCGIEGPYITCTEHDHIDMCKPRLQSSLEYLTIRQFVSNQMPRRRRAVDVASMFGVFLNIASPALSRVDIKQCINSDKNIPTRHFYEHDWCAENWCNFFEDRSGHEVYALKQVISETRVIEAIRAFTSPEISYVSIGVGDGQKDKAIIDWLGHHVERPIVYRPLDISVPLLKKACSRVSRITDIDISIKYIYGDFMDLHPGIFFDGTQCLVSVLGNSLGNTQYDRELINLIGRAMGAGDLLLLDARAVAGFDSFMGQSADFLKASKFSFGPLETLGTYDFDVSLLSLKQEDSASYSHINGGKAAVVYYSNKQPGQTEVDEWRLDHINFYSRGQLEKQFTKCHLSPVHAEEIGGNLYFLLKKN